MIRTARLIVALAVAWCCAVAGAAAQDSSDTRFQALLGLARVKRDAGDAAGARRHFEQADALRTLSAAERAEYFWVLAGNDAPAALQTGLRVLSEAPRQSAVRDRTISEAIAVGDEDTVASLASAGERLEPTVALWPRRLAESLVRRGRWADAAAAYARATRASDASEEDAVGLALSLESGGQYPAAVRAWSAVPASLVTRQPQWEMSRLRALAHGEPSAATAEAIEIWLRAHPADAAMRSLAASTWTRARQPWRAVQVLAAGADAASGDDIEWLRRAVSTARTHALAADAAAQAARLSASAQAKPADRLLLPEVHLESGNLTAAAAALRALPGVERCRDAALALADRIPGDSGTSWLVAIAVGGDCQPSARWRHRALDRAVAESRFADAIAVIDALAEADRNRHDILCLEGQLHLWSGDPARAIPLLTRALEHDPAAVPVRASLVDAYRATGRAAEAWNAARLFPAASLPAERRIDLAEIAIEAGHAEAAAAILIELAPGDGASEHKRRELVARTADALHARYVEAGSTGTLRDAGEWRAALAALDNARAREADAAIIAALMKSAAASASAGNRSAARLAAEAVVHLDAHNVTAWFALVDLAADDGLPQLAATLDRARGGSAARLDLATAIAERLSGFVRMHGASIVDMGVRWIDEILDGRRDAGLGVARARLLATGDRRADAIATLDRVLAAEPTHAPALVLQADVLSWSGEHRRAIDAYAAYLAQQPGDLDARRQMARVAGWAGWTDLALQYYAAAEAAHPDHAALEAEHAAKKAFFEGRWRAAASAYARWVALEPGNGEARFEQAQAERAAGRARSADDHLRALAATGLHALAPEAWRRVQLDRQPHATARLETRASNGYAGQRLLDRQLEGAFARATFGAAGALTVDGGVAHARLTGGETSRTGFHATLRAAATMSASFSVAADAALWDVWSGARPAMEGSARLIWRMADRWMIAGGIERALMFENLEAADARVAASGPFAAISFESSRSSFGVHGAWQDLSDANTRRRLSVAATRVLHNRVRGLRAIVWSEFLSFLAPSPLYYSPAAQVRLDAGLQYTHEFRVARFRGDRTSRVTAAYLAGTDRHGVLYHHPTFAATIELANGLAVEARADWVRSAVYRERTLSVSLTRGLGRRF